MWPVTKRPSPTLGCGAYPVDRHGQLADASRLGLQGVGLAVRPGATVSRLRFGHSNKRPSSLRGRYCCPILPVKDYKPIITEKANSS